MQTPATGSQRGCTAAAARQNLWRFTDRINQFWRATVRCRAVVIIRAVIIVCGVVIVAPLTVLVFKIHQTVAVIVDAVVTEFVNTGTQCWISVVTIHSFRAFGIASDRIAVAIKIRRVRSSQPIAVIVDTVAVNLLESWSGESLSIITVTGAGANSITIGVSGSHSQRRIVVITVHIGTHPIAVNICTGSAGLKLPLINRVGIEQWKAPNACLNGLRWNRPGIGKAGDPAAKAVVNLARGTAAHLPIYLCPSRHVNRPHKEVVTTSDERQINQTCIKNRLAIGSHTDLHLHASGEWSGGTGCRLIERQLRSLRRLQSKTQTGALEQGIPAGRKDIAKLTQAGRQRGGVFYRIAIESAGNSDQRLNWLERSAQRHLHRSCRIPTIILAKSIAQIGRPPRI